jgi:hypothetical protein
MAKKTIKGPLPPDTRTFVQRVKDRVVEWRKGKKASDPAEPIHVRTVDKKLNAEFDAMIAQARTRGNFNATLEGTDDGFSVYCRIQPRMFLHSDGQTSSYLCFTIANIHMDDNLRRKGLFPAFLDHVEKVLLNSAKPCTVGMIEYQQQPKPPIRRQTPILAVYVESITNPDLTHYLRERRSGKYVKAPDPFAMSDLVRFRKDAAEHMRKIEI